MLKEFVRLGPSSDSISVLIRRRDNNQSPGIHSFSLSPSAHKEENMDEDTEKKQLSLNQEERPQ